MPLTPFEQAISEALAELAAITASIGETQMLIAGYLADRLPNLPEADRAELRTAAAKGKRDAQQFLQIAKKLQEALQN